MTPEDVNVLKAQINIAKGQLGMAEADYRQMLARVTGKDSLRAMTPGELIEVIHEMKRLGFKVVSARFKKPAVAADKRPLVDKINALLADAKRPWDYLTGKSALPPGTAKAGKGADKSMLERLTGKQAVRFCTAAELRKVIAALEVDKKRREGRAAEGGE
jgi:phage gp16-like protein